jgi:aminopeptidase N
MRSQGASAPQRTRTAPAPSVTHEFTRADTLRGAMTPQRAWWDVTFYDLHVAISPSDKTLRGATGITYRVRTPAPAQEMQIDLLPPLEIDSIRQDDRTLIFRREGRAVFVALAAPQPPGAQKTLTVYYHGTPQMDISKGLMWSRDSLGRPWIATSVQHRRLGPSTWWPSKDHQADEPDSQRIAVTVPDSLVNVSNGRLRRTTRHQDGTTTYEWFVTSPINSYTVALNAGRYAHFSDIYQGQEGKLMLGFWPLDYHADVAKQHFQQVKPILRCFESWFGPYPWYRDGYQLVETPYLGMEHQSAIAYGNGYRNGYQGKDFYNTGGLGLRWDYILVHETAHEWFGNNITAQDAADNWVHESFATYAEGLYTECQFGADSGAAYLVRARPKTDAPDWRATMVGPYGFAMQGESIYPKGAGVLHTLRQVIADDAKWRKILQGLNRTFRRQTVTGQQVVDYIAAQAGPELRPILMRYLTVPGVPVLEYRLTDSVLAYRWTDVVPGFAMPIKVTLADGVYRTLRPTEAWQTVAVRLSAPEAFRADPNYYVAAKAVQ